MYSSLAIQTSPAQEGTPRRAAPQPPSPPERPRSYVLKRAASTVETATRRPRPTTICLSSISEAKATGWTMPSAEPQSSEAPVIRRQTTRESLAVRSKERVIANPIQEKSLARKSSAGPAAIAGSQPLLRIRSDRVQDRIAALAERDGVSTARSLTRTSSSQSMMDRTGPSSGLTRTSSVREMQPRSRPTGRDSIVPTRPATTPVKSTPLKSTYSRATTERDPVARIRTRRDSNGSARSPMKPIHSRATADRPPPVSFRLQAPATPPMIKRTSSRPMSSIGFVAPIRDPQCLGSSSLLKRSSSVASVRPGDKVDLIARYRAREDIKTQGGRIATTEKTVRPSSRLSALGLRRTESLSRV